MKQTLLALVTLLIFACAPGQTAARRQKVDVVRRAFHNTVALQTDGSVTCSGVISDGRILTAAHCVKDDIWVDFEWRGEEYEGWVQHLDEAQDIATIHTVDVRLGRGVPLARKAPKYAASVWVIGHSLGDSFPYSITRGIVGHPRRTEVFGQKRLWMQHDAGILGGNSGGPVLNRRGRLVGITSFGIMQTPVCMFRCDGIFVDTYIRGAVHWEVLKQL